MVGTGGRRSRRAAVAAAAMAIGAAGLVACSSEQARTCTEEAGATFCVKRQSEYAVEVSASGLREASSFTAVLEGEGVPDPAGAEPHPIDVGPEGTAGGLTLGVTSLTGEGLSDGTTVVFAGTSADGSPVTANVVVGG